MMTIQISPLTVSAADASGEEFDDHGMQPNKKKLKYCFNMMHLSYRRIVCFDLAVQPPDLRDFAFCCGTQRIRFCPGKDTGRVPR